ncbi:MAG: DUF2961 domain-containing protein [Planctomycetes bacterium]|nr:DUF2961 domain-containing protein [Planctomycetota bacterium]
MMTICYRTSRLVPIATVLCVLSCLNDRYSKPTGEEVSEITSILGVNPDLDIYSGDDSSAQAAVVSPLNLQGVTDRLAVLSLDAKNRTRALMQSGDDLTGGNCDSWQLCETANPPYIPTYIDTVTGLFVVFDVKSNDKITLTNINFAATSLSGIASGATVLNFPQQIQIYVDSNPTPLYSGYVLDLANNNGAPFAGYEAGAVNIYYPRINGNLITGSWIRVMTAQPWFYQFDYEMGKGIMNSVVTSWSNVFNNAGQWPHLAVPNWVSLPATSILPLNITNLLNVTAPGVFLGMKFTVSSPADFTSLRIKIEFDGNQTVDVPLGMFCGGSHPAYNISAALFRRNGLDLYNYFPMPFRNSSKIVIQNSSLSQIPISFQYVFLGGNYPEPFGYFHVKYSETLPTTVGYDHIVLNTYGCGKYVGTVQDTELNACIPQVSFGYAEGDVRIYQDGSNSYTHTSGGTETYFNWGWYDQINADYQFTRPSYGNSGFVITSINTSCPPAQVRSMYRLHLVDQKPFYRSIKVTFEHGGDYDPGSPGNANANYRTAAFYYSTLKPKLVVADTVDLGNSASEISHNFTVLSGSITPSSLNAKYAGDFTYQYFNETGYYINGQVRFNAVIPSSNTGARIRVRTDRYYGKLEATVRINGTYVGTLYRAFSNKASTILNGNNYGRFSDDELEISYIYTYGQSTLQITIDTQSSPDQVHIYKCEVLAYR